MSIYVFGDFHKDYTDLNNVLQFTNQNDIILQCGDFGYFRKSRFGEGTGWYYDDIINPNCTKIYFCDGNHEDLTELNYLTRTYGWENPIHIGNNIFYCPRGSELVLPTKERVLFMGGGKTTSRKDKYDYIDWFPDEIISLSDFNRIDQRKHYDIIVSHTCPSMCSNRMLYKLNTLLPDRFDYCCDVLQALFEVFTPKKWFYGHWHLSDNFIMNCCEFTVLNKANRKGHYIKYD